MTKGVQDFQVKESLSPAIKAVDVNASSGAKLDPTRAIHISVAARYRCFFSNVPYVDSSTNYVSLYLNDGATYPYSLVNILTSAGSTISADNVALLY